VRVPPGEPAFRDTRRRAERECDLDRAVGRYEVDLLWRPQRLAVEVDGYTYHATRAAFERDRRRDAELVALGYRVVRLTWRQIVEDEKR
jgi:very-short-patch-repair endonuclease